MDLKYLLFIIIISIIFIGVSYCIHIAKGAREIVSNETVGVIYAYPEFDSGTYIVLDTKESYDGEGMRITILTESSTGCRCAFWTRCYFYKPKPSDSYQLLGTLIQGDRINVYKDEDKIRITKYYG